MLSGAKQEKEVELMFDTGSTGFMIVCNEMNRILALRRAKQARGSR